jgi:hypothetical protein
MARSKKDRKEVVISVRVTAAAKEAAEKRAKSEGRTLGNYVSWLITKDLAEDPKKK